MIATETFQESSTQPENWPAVQDVESWFTTVDATITSGEATLEKAGVMAAMPEMRNVEPETVLETRPCWQDTWLDAMDDTLDVAPAERPRRARALIGQMDEALEVESPAERARQALDHALARLGSPADRQAAQLRRVPPVDDVQQPVPSSHTRGENRHSSGPIDSRLQKAFVTAPLSGLEQLDENLGVLARLLAQMEQRLERRNTASMRVAHVVAA